MITFVHKCHNCAEVILAMRWTVRPIWCSKDCFLEQHPDGEAYEV